MLFSRLPFVRHSLPASYLPLLGTRIPWPGAHRACRTSPSSATATPRTTTRWHRRASCTPDSGWATTRSTSSPRTPRPTPSGPGKRRRPTETDAGRRDRRQALAGSPPADNDLVVFCGDLNIVGGQRKHRQPFDDEWHDRFDVPGSGVLTDHLIDVWGRDQCKGAAPGTPVKRAGLRDPGFTAPSSTRRLAAPRLRVREQRRRTRRPAPSGRPRLSLVTVSGLGYLSDHKPLSADIHRRQDFNTPAKAEVLVAAPDDSRTDSLADGSVHWYRINEDGTYEIALWSAGDRAATRSFWTPTSPPPGRSSVARSESRRENGSCSPARRS